MISYLVPDKPEWVETAVASIEYQSKLAYKRQVCSTECLLRDNTLYAENIFERFFASIM